jgi:tetratricopeptide (TPR) repeat protein
MALSYAISVAWEWPNPRLSSDSLLARGSRAATAALARDSTSSDSWLARAMILWFEYPTDWTLAMAAHDRAVALDPSNAEAYNIRGVALGTLRRDSESIASLDRALALDPLRPIALMRKGEVLFSLGRRAEGERLVDSALAVAPAFAQGYIDRAQMRLARRDVAGAEKDLATAFRFSGEAAGAEHPIPLGLLAEAAAMRGDTATARAQLATLKAQLHTDDGLRPNAATAVALAMIASGDRNGALRVLERAVPRGLLLWWTMGWPDFDSIRGDARFQAVMKGAPVPTHTTRGGTGVTPGR